MSESCCGTRPDVSSAKSKTGFAAKALLVFIRLYQFTLSTVMGKSCRFYPTCSYYTADAIRRFGAVRGTYLGMARIFRCHPWHAGGYDPVPEIFPPLLNRKAKFSSESGCGCAKAFPHNHLADTGLSCGVAPSGPPTTDTAAGPPGQPKETTR